MAVIWLWLRWIDDMIFENLKNGRHEEEAWEFGGLLNGRVNLYKTINL